MNSSSHRVNDYNQSHSRKHETNVNIRLSECEGAKSTEEEKNELNEGK